MERELRLLSNEVRGNEMILTIQGEPIDVNSIIEHIGLYFKITKDLERPQLKKRE